MTLNGRDVYLGRHGSPESRDEYDRLVAEWLTNRRRNPGHESTPGGDTTVNELVLAYLRWADGYYVKNGKPTSEPVNIRLALRPFRKMYGNTLAREFGPLALRAVRSKMIESDLCRAEVNKRVRHVVRAVKWAVSVEMIPPSVHHGLQTVSGLRRGRSEARESEPVRPVADELVDAIEPFVSRQVWAMVSIQRLTGARPGEICMMRGADLDMTGRTWVYIPESHKTEHHGRERKIYLGPKAIEVVRPWLRDEPLAYLFSPTEAEAARREAQRQARRSKVQPSQMNRKKSKPRKSPRDRYETDSYRRAIQYGCKRAGIIPWHPHRLRHSAATRLRRDFGLDVARAVLGHATTTVTEHYAEMDATKAAEAMEQVG